MRVNIFSIHHILRTWQPCRQTALTRSPKGFWSKDTRVFRIRILRKLSLHATGEILEEAFRHRHTVAAPYSVPICCYPYLSCFIYKVLKISVTGGFIDFNSSCIILTFHHRQGLTVLCIFNQKFNSAYTYLSVNFTEYFLYFFDCQMIRCLQRSH